MKKNAFILLLALILNGCSPGRLREADSDEKTAQRIFPTLAFRDADSMEIQLEFDMLISKSKEALSAKYSGLRFGKTAWYRFPPSNPDGILFYAVFDCRGVSISHDMQPQTTIENVIIPLLAPISKRMNDTGRKAVVWYYSDSHSNDGFSMVFSIRKREGDR